MRTIEGGGGCEALAETDLCRTLFGLGESQACHRPVQEILGGSFQLSDVVPLDNSQTGDSTCPEGYQAVLLAETRAFHTSQPETFDPVRIHLCVSVIGNLPELQNQGCPEGQTPIVESGQSLCSDLPRRACESFDGVFDGQSGRCKVAAAKTVFGGFFETGEPGEASQTQVTILSPDENPLEEKLERCERPNRFAGLETFSCPEGFDVFSSSTYAEHQGGWGG